MSEGVRDLLTRLVEGYLVVELSHVSINGGAYTKHASRATTAGIMEHVHANHHGFFGKTLRKRRVPEGASDLSIYLQSYLTDYV